ncbi:MAG TPA: ATP-binding protein [Vicinamibacterales bacterium]|nr:ATP-binding protein [Vicinamibacterales bacterium]
MTLTLRARLAVIWTVVFGLLIVILSVVSYDQFERSLDADMNVRLTELTDGLHGYLREDGEGLALDFDASDNDQAAFVREATRYYQIYDRLTARLLTSSPEINALGLRLTPSEVQTYGDDQRTLEMTTDVGRIRISNSVIPGINGRSYLLQVGISLRQLDGALLQYRQLLLWLLPLALVAAVLVARWLSGFALRPLGDVAEAARAIDVSSLERRVPMRGVNDELEDVARAFNDILARLEQSVAEMRQFSAALAHELRTPLTAMRGEMELALGRMQPDDPHARAVASQIEEIDALRRLIDSILTLARAEAGQIPLVFAPVDLGELSASLVDQLMPVAEAKGVALRCERDGPTIVAADAGWLERLLLNLMDNALKFTEAGGQVCVRVEKRDGGARLIVRDSGIGMTSEVASHVFDRFFRADPARSSGSGSGLGLTLVAWIVDRHDGTIALASEPGKGSTFTVTLPVTHDPASEHLRVPFEQARHG